MINNERQPTQRNNCSRLVVCVEIAPGLTHRFYPETGELPGYQLGQVKVREHRVEKYVGEDTIFPVNASMIDALDNAVRVHDRWLDRRTFYAERILDLLDSGLDVNAVRVFRWFCESVSARNVWFGCIKGAQQALGFSSATVTRAVSALSLAGLIRVVPQGRGKQTRVNVHPWYVFVGDRYIQEQYLATWVRRKFELG